MPLNTHNALRALTDLFTPVRDLNGTLLGCIPKVHEQAELVTGSNGAAFELRIAAQVCVCVNLDDPLQSTSYLDGFIPLADPVPTTLSTGTGGDDPDLAIGV